MNAAQKRYFTLAEANQRLPLVRVIVQDIVALYRDVHSRRERLSRIRQRRGNRHRDDEESLYSEEVRQMEDDIDKDIARLEGYVEELGQLGAELKDYQSGLVDFLTHVDGREAYLCWRLGEDEIAYWHPLESGFGGRQPLFESSIPGEAAAEDEQN